MIRKLHRKNGKLNYIQLDSTLCNKKKTFYIDGNGDKHRLTYVVTMEYNTIHLLSRIRIEVWKDGHADNR